MKKDTNTINREELADLTLYLDSLAGVVAYIEETGTYTSTVVALGINQEAIIKDYLNGDLVFKGLLMTMPNKQAVEEGLKNKSYKRHYVRVQSISTNLL